MNESGGVYSITIPLKRGIYDYQYVAADVENGEIINPDWLVLEGNTWLTQKNMTSFFIITSRIKDRTRGSLGINGRKFSRKFN